MTKATTKNVYVKSWHSGRNYYYHIIGKQSDCIEYFEKNILAFYGMNPYMTMVRKKGNYFVLASRADSCD